MPLQSCVPQSQQSSKTGWFQRKRAPYTWVSDVSVGLLSCLVQSRQSSRVLQPTPLCSSWNQDIEKGEWKVKSPKAYLLEIEAGAQPWSQAQTPGFPPFNRCRSLCPGTRVKRKSWRAFLLCLAWTIILWGELSPQDQLSYRLLVMQKWTGEVFKCLISPLLLRLQQHKFPGTGPCFSWLRRGRAQPCFWESTHQADSPWIVMWFVLIPKCDVSC